MLCKKDVSQYTVRTSFLLIEYQDAISGTPFKWCFSHSHLEISRGRHIDIIGNGIEKHKVAMLLME
jgi:hypothetical protein